MLKIFSFTLLIISFVLISCTSDEESSSGYSPSYATSTSGATASGTITIGSDTISGTYASVCGTSSDSSAPSDSTYLGFVVVVTSSTSYTRELNYYTDSACTSLSLGWWYVNDNGSIGDVSGSDYKIAYTQINQTLLASTTTAETFIEDALSNIALDVTVGTNKVISTNFPMYNLVRVSGGILYMGTESTSSYPSTGGEAQFIKQ